MVGLGRDFHRCQSSGRGCVNYTYCHKQIGVPNNNISYGVYIRPFSYGNSSIIRTQCSIRIRFRYYIHELQDLYIKIGYNSRYSRFMDRH